MIPSLNQINRSVDRDFRMRFKPFLISAIVSGGVFLIDPLWESYGILLPLILPLIAFLLATFRSFKHDLRQRRNAHDGIFGRFTFVWLIFGGGCMLTYLKLFSIGLDGLLTPALVLVPIGAISAIFVLHIVFDRVSRYNVFSNFQVGLSTMLGVVGGVILWFFYESLMYKLSPTAFDIPVVGIGSEIFNFLYDKRPFHQMGFAVAAWQIVMGIFFSLTDRSEKIFTKIEKIGIKD